MRGRGRILGILMGCGSLFIDMIASSPQEERALHAQDKKIKQYTEDLKEFLKDNPPPTLDKKNKRFLEEAALHEKKRKEEAPHRGRENEGLSQQGNQLSYSPMPVRIYMSFKVPLGVWQSYAADLAKVEGAFVVRGLPDNSFEAFYKEAARLKKAGVSAPILLDPKSFSRHGIKRVPVVEVKGDREVAWMKGAVRLPYVLDYLAARMEDKGISALRDILYGRESREEEER